MEVTQEDANIAEWLLSVGLALTKASGVRVALLEKKTFFQTPHYEERVVEQDSNLEITRAHGVVGRGAKELFEKISKETVCEQPDVFAFGKGINDVV